MNKQEVIEKINNAVAHETFMTERVWLKYDEAIDIINQLDEPEKPVLTKEEAEWLESLEALSWLNKYDALYYIVRQGFGHGFSYTSKGHTSELETPTKIGDTVDLKARLVNAILFGYTVKEEKLYTAKLKLTNEYLHYDKNYKEIRHYKIPDDVANKVKAYHFIEDDLVKYHIWGNDAYDVNEVKE